MDGKTSGLIVGDNFVIDEGEIVAAQFTPQGEFGAQGVNAESVLVHMRCAQSVFVAGPLAKKLFDRAKAAIENRKAGAEKRQMALNEILNQSRPRRMLRENSATLANPHSGSTPPVARPELLGGEIQQTQIIDEIDFLLSDKRFTSAAHSSSVSRELLNRRARWERRRFVTSDGEVWQWRYRDISPFIETAPLDDDWRAKCETGWKSYNSVGQRTEVWVRWTDPTTGLYYFLHPVVLRWGSKPEQITMPTFINEKEAASALLKAPAPPGFTA